MPDKIIQELEAARKKIAERNGYEVKRIAADLRRRAAERREKYDAALSSVPDNEPDERDRIE